MPVGADADEAVPEPTGVAPGADGPVRPPLFLVLSGLAAAFVAALFAAAAVGPVRVPLWDVVTVVLAELGLPVTVIADDTDARIIATLRLPRILVAAGAGAALGVAGAFLQGALRNPLAEPVTTGTAAGALLGASLALVATVGAAVLDAPATAGALVVRILAAAVVAWLGTLLVVATARSAGRIATGPLLLAGLAVNAIVGSLAALALFLGSVGAQTAAVVVTSWMFGGLLLQAGPVAYRPLLAVILLCLAVLLLLSRSLDQLLLGEEEAAAAGVHVGRVRHGALATAALATGAAVAVAGVLAFVGLLAPHLVRRWTGPLHVRLVPAAALAGAILLMAADALGRAVAGRAELPAGVVTAALGAPLLLVLLRRTLRGHGVVR